MKCECGREVISPELAIEAAKIGQELLAACRRASGMVQTHLNSLWNAHAPEHIKTPWRELLAQLQDPISKAEGNSGARYDK